MRLNGRLTYSAGLCATLLLGWLTAAAQTSVPVSNLGTISGRVVNESGRPLVNARITLRPPGAMVSNQDITTTTDRDGKFAVSGLKPMSYQVSAFLQGYVPVTRDEAAAGIYHVGDSVSLVMTKGGVITGTVTKQAGEPVVGVRVQAMAVGWAEQPNEAMDRTDDRGVYRIYGLREGTYVVWAGGRGLTPDSFDSFADDVRTYAPASTRGTAQEIAVRGGAEVNGVDISYRGGSGYAVSGRVKVPAIYQNVPFAIFLTSTSGPHGEVRSVHASDDGGFMLSGLDDGDYEIIATSDRPDLEEMVSVAKQIKVRGADVEDVELIVQPLSSITGRVVLEESVITECKRRPIFAETLISVRGASSPPSFTAFKPTVNADEQGNVTLKNLSPDRYYFTTQLFAEDWYLKSISFVPAENAKDAKLIDAARTWTTLKYGDRLKGLTFTLVPGAASLRGQIELSKGETSAEKVYVYLVPAEKEAANDPLRFYGAEVTAAGKVALRNLAPGRYLVLARRAPDSSALTTLRSPAGIAYRAIMRREAEALKTEIELKPCQKVVDFKVPVGAN